MIAHERMQLVWQEPYKKSPILWLSLSCGNPESEASRVCRIATELRQTGGIENEREAKVLEELATAYDMKVDPPSFWSDHAAQICFVKTFNAALHIEPPIYLDEVEDKRAKLTQIIKHLEKDVSSLDVFGLDSIARRLRRVLEEIEIEERALLLTEKGEIDQWVLSHACGGAVGARPGNSQCPDLVG